jgi:YbbR domain-containing protein
VATDVDFKNLHLTPKEQIPILVEIIIGPKEVTRTISGVTVTAGPKKAQLRPSQVTLTLQGPTAAVKDLKPGDLKAGVDTRNLAPGRHRLKVQVTLPPEVRLLQVQPETLTAQVAPSP